MTLQLKKSWKDLAVKALGAATSGTLLGYLKAFVPQLGLSDEILTTLVGFVLEEGILIKNNLLENYGEGVLLAGLSNLIAGFIPAVAGTIHLKVPQPKRAPVPERNLPIEVGGAY